MRTNYTVRRANPDDGHAILAAPHAALARLRTVSTTVDGLAWLRAPARALDALIAAGRYHVVEQNGQLVAGVGWEPHEQIADTAVLRSVIVDPSQQGRALSADLMRAAEAQAAAAGFSHIMVPALPAAIDFYRRLGYVGADPDDLVLEAGLRIAYQRMWKRAA